MLSVVSIVFILQIYHSIIQSVTLFIYSAIIEALIPKTGRNIV